MRTKHFFNKFVVVILGNFVFSAFGFGQDAFEIEGKKTSIKDLYRLDQAGFYEVEKKKYELVDRLAKEKYLDHYWNKKAKEMGKSVAEAKNEYFSKNAKISDKEIKDTLEQYKDHPQLAKMPKKEQEDKIKEFLNDRKKSEALDNIVNTAMAKGELKVLYPTPQEPVYEVSLKETDPVRYGPKTTDIKPVKCSGNECQITVVEYSEFQCPFCGRVMPAATKILEDYKGKIRWAVRDFPLNFHNRARPAAIAARCALQQSKYWEMYTELFANQRGLEDADLVKYAEKVGVDKQKFQQCYSNPKDIEKVIDENLESGAKLGVSGTPAFFINGRKLSGALPYDEFKRVIDDELKKSKKS